MPIFAARWRLAVLVSLLLGAVSPARAASPEAWTDARLRVVAGLAAWYDAAAENRARQSAGMARQKSDRPVELWHDGSGHQRHLRQPVAEARPVVRSDDELRYVRFDGAGTSLAADGAGLALDAMTLFVVAAPFSNDGGFRGLVAGNADGRNDYVSGFTLDLGPLATRKFAELNVEGAGFQGARNLKREPAPFGHVGRLCVVSTVGAGGTRLFFDGRRELARDRSDGRIRIDRLTVGARYYNNAGPPETAGFLRGEIAEVLLYDRALDDAQRAGVDDYLKAKYGEGRTVPLPRELAAGRPIPRVEEPPPVRMFVPGFAATALPVELPNVNNVRYRSDGLLVAMGYDGRIHLLRDTDGDGLEDRATVFWDRPGILSPIGIALAPPDAERGHGVYVACKGQVVLVVDRDRDDVADELIVVAGGWKPLEHSVDAMGIAVAADGSVYFGMGTTDFTNAYLVDAQGRGHYAATDEHGAILRVGPGFERREQVCSGVRFPVALAFNRAGDLFCTDQEGATWLPNGNPFDELLHIEPGRHYGFPPRHPRHLEHVVDEPSVYDFGPQHQSTCGLCFNEPAAGGRPFGPDWWRGNALICGYSRGKLYRTTLAKTSPGYVADTALLGCLNMLAVDACLSPDGKLVVAAHGGGPDWGSGPNGKGRLFQIAYRDLEQPQPVRAWPSGPHEVHVALDRPLDPAGLRRFAERVLIEYGPYVRAGDRFESLAPGYSVVEVQSRGSRRLLPVLRAELTADRRALLLATGAHAQAVGYAVLLPELAAAGARRSSVDADAAESKGANSEPASDASSDPAIELSYELTGVDVSWQPVDPRAGGWSSWLPHLDVAAAEGLLAGTSEAERLAEICRLEGRLTLRAQLDLWQMLRPALQPGSKLDYELPAERVTVELESAAPIVVRSEGVEHRSQPTGAGTHQVSWTVSPQENAWQAVEVVVVTGRGGKVLEAGWHTADDGRRRAFPMRRFFVPWARPVARAGADERPEVPAELAGGDWQRGRALFFGEHAQCGKCHAVRGQGGWIGPDLSNLVHRDYRSVLRDIAEPNYAINPEHLAYNIELADGRVITGMVQARGERLAIGDARGIETVVPRDQVAQVQPAVLSIMPEGLSKTLGPGGMADLLAFLLTAEPGGLQPAPIEQPGAPPPRSRAEVGAVLAQAQPPAVETLAPLEILLVAGPKDHGPGEHDYPAWQRRWSRLFGRASKVRVATADAWPAPDAWRTADTVVMFSANPAWTPERAADLDAFFARGGGLVLLHYAVNGQRAPDELARRIGLAWQPDRSRFRHGELDLDLRMPRPHPITSGFSRLELVDESYWNLAGDVSAVQVLATQVEEGQPRPILWTYEPPGGRVFASILGHYSWTFDDPLFRVLVLRGIAWAARQPIDRFNDLVLDGARVE